MPFDFSSFQVAPGEKPASSAKFNNFLNAVQAAVNGMPPANLSGYPGDAAKFLNGAGGWTTPVTDMAQVFTLETPTGDLQGQTLFDLVNFAIPGGKMGSHAALKLYCGGTYVNGDTVQRTLRTLLTLGGQTIWDQTSEQVAITSANKRAWHLALVIQSAGATGGGVSNKQFTSGTFWIGSVSNAATGFGLLAQLNSTPTFGTPIVGPAAGTTVDMTGAQTLRLQGSHSSTNANLTINRLYARLEVTA
jgi:hypothetical protein